MSDTFKVEIYYSDGVRVPDGAKLPITPELNDTIMRLLKEQWRKDHQQ